MKSRWNFLYVGIATVLLLSACSADTDQEKPDSEVNTAEVVGNEADADAPEDTDKDAVEDDTDTDAGVETDQPAKKDDEVAKDKESDTIEATLTPSEEQDYAISVLANYTLMSEEPGKDSLYANDDESSFMRIETLAKDDASYDYLVENMGDMLEAMGDGNTPVALTDASSLPTGDGIDNVTALAVQTATGSFTAMVFERDGLIIRLTMFDSANQEHFKSFLQMGETIVKK